MGCWASSVQGQEQCVDDGDDENKTIAPGRGSSRSWIALVVAERVSSATMRTLEGYVMDNENVT